MDKNKQVYMNNPNLPAEGSVFEYTTDQIKQLQKAAKNLLYFAEQFFYIISLDEGRQKIALHPVQKRALRKMRDNRFQETVIAMLENDEDGAWGLVINKRLGTMPIALLIDPSLNTSEEREELFKLNIPIFWGGPVDTKEIFILHSNEYKSKSTIKYENISISQDYEILFDIAKNKGPNKYFIGFTFIKLKVRFVIADLLHHSTELY